MSNLYASKPLTKPLKGGSIVSNLGSFETIEASNLKLETLNIAGVFEDGIFLNVIIQDSELRNTVIGVDGPSVGYFTQLQTRSDVNMLSNLTGVSVSWDPDTGQFYISSSNGSFKVDGCSYLGNLEICRNDIRATNFNGDINLYPNNSGTVYVKGPFNTTATTGNFYALLADGSVTFLAKKDVFLHSSSGSGTFSTFGKQTYTTVNGDISLNTDAGVTRGSLATTRFTQGSIILTSPLSHNLVAGDVVLLTTGSLNGGYTVGSVVNNTTFSLTTTTNAVSVATGGNFIKVASNSILLNSKAYVKIPDTTKLSFNNTTNSVYGNTGGIVFISDNIQIPQTTKFQFGTSGSNYVNFDAESLNIGSSNVITLTGSTTLVNTTNTKFYDPILSIANYTEVVNDGKDRGIEFNYFDTNTSSSKLGWFGYKNDTKRFTFIVDAVNNNEVVSGTLGSLELSNLSLTTINIGSGGVIDMSCGKILNASLISGCSNNLTLAGSSNVTVNATNRIALSAGVDVLIPTNVPLKFGTSGSSIKENTSNNTLELASYRSISIVTESKGNISIPVETTVSLDGSSRGNLYSDTSGNVILKTSGSTGSLFLTTTTGSVIVPSNTNLQLGTATQTVSGSSSGLTIVSSNTTGTISVVANSNVNISSSFGNIVIASSAGNIVLSPNQSVRIPEQKTLVFNTNVTSQNNSIGVVSSGAFVITGNTNNTLDLLNVSDINLSASSVVRIPEDVKLSMGTSNQTYLVTTSSKQTILTNANTGGTITITSKTTELSNTSGSLNILNTSTNISSGTLNVVGTNAKINADNTSFLDPILTIGDKTLASTDGLDRGIEYRYFNVTSGTMKLGWFGQKGSTSRFTYYSDAINVGEVISGTMGDMEVGSLFLNNNLSFSRAGYIDVSCGTIANVSTIQGCGGVLNLNGTTSINASASSINLNASQKVALPFNVPLQFGSTSNAISCDSVGNLTIKTGKVIFDSNIQVNGETATIYSTVTNIKDPIISIGGVEGPLTNDGKDRGIEFKWNNGSVSKVGFFGYKQNLGRFVFIRDGTNNSEVFSGNFGDVEFNAASLGSIQMSNGAISGVNVLSGGEVTIQTTSGNLFLTPTTGSNVIMPFNSKLGFGSTSSSISSDTAGNITIVSREGSINLSTSDSIRMPGNVPVYIGDTTSTYIMGTGGNLDIRNGSGDINLVPQTSNGSIIIPVNNYLAFGSTDNSIQSDGEQLLLRGYKGISISSSTVTIAGSINILGTLSAANSDFDMNKYILPLGTQQVLNVTSIVSAVGSSGNVTVVTQQTSGYFSIGDFISLENTGTSPLLDGTHVITRINGPNSFNIQAPSLVTGSSFGTLRANLTSYQGKDVGIQVNYWTTSGNTNVTAGSQGYRTGFFGFKLDTERWSFYSQATNSNDVISGDYGDIQVNKVFTSKMSGFTLEGPVTAGSNNISGTSFTIGGGSINNTPIGQTDAQLGRFSTLSNTTRALLNNIEIENTIRFRDFERFEVRANNPATWYRSPLTSCAVTLFKIVGTSFSSACGTMDSSSSNVLDGTFKMVVCSGMGEGCTYTLYFGPNKLITPNPLNSNHIPTKLIFKRRSQSVQMIFDSNQEAWILLSTGIYVE